MLKMKRKVTTYFYYVFIVAAFPDLITNMQQHDDTVGCHFSCIEHCMSEYELDIELTKKHPYLNLVSKICGMPAL